MEDFDKITIDLLEIRAQNSNNQSEKDFYNFLIDNFFDYDNLTIDDLFNALERVEELGACDEDSFTKILDEIEC